MWSFRLSLKTLKARTVRAPREASDGSGSPRRVCALVPDTVVRARLARRVECPPRGRHVRRRGARLFEPQAPFFETDKLVMPQNDMVQQLDIEHFAGMPQLLRGADIFG